MILMPMLVVSDVTASAAFYQRLGFPVRLRARNGDWVELHAGDGARLGIHRQRADVESKGQYQLSLATDRPLEELAEELERSGIAAPDGILDEAFGRTMTVYDPDGTPIMISELDEDLYT